ncbi:Lysosomal beta glucosidase [Morus notabilis]|uniref:Lysosomal beta glucosidase n=1 Tax=Morus notabilis TaxID=981085 RepID=W9RXF6_9ROSA|nr:Lysosomal beta glucosidase [Morus notabilis]
MVKDDIVVGEDLQEKCCVYRNPNDAVEARVKDLLCRMTLEEKVGQMTQIERRVATADPGIIRSRFIGSMLSATGSGPAADASFCDWANMVNEFQKSALETRLAIPLLYGIDAIHGNGSVSGATIFPHNVGLGATRDPDLVREIGAATALEVKASGIHCTYAPCVATQRHKDISVCKDPRWGRCYESYSEDTEIVRNMTSIVTGLQGQPPKGHPKGYPFIAGSRNTIACAKHFVGDGGTENGQNEGNTVLHEKELERIHMAPYLDCIEKGVCMVMASYSSWNGCKMHSNRKLLTEVLKDKLGFKVIVPYRCELFVDHLLDLVNSGEVSVARIDDAVERILRVKFVARLFEHPYSEPNLLDSVTSKRHRELAREAVQKSLVLLKNGKDHSKPLLPLKGKPKTILVAGSHAHNLGYQCGGWTRKWLGFNDKENGRFTTGTTILEAISEGVGEETEVIHEENPSTETLQREDISLAIVAVGEFPYAESFGDDSKLEIPKDGKATDIINSVADRFPTLVIMISGRPLFLEPELLEKIDALVAAWLPGTEGGGIADVVFGDHEFQGRLPVTWFRSVEQLPMNAENECCDSLFRLGFGLTKAEGINVEEMCLSRLRHEINVDGLSCEYSEHVKDHAMVGNQGSSCNPSLVLV